MQRSRSHPRHRVLRQTGGKMLYFPSKLKCQLILMWKWRLSSTQHSDTQTRARKQHLRPRTQTQIQNLESRPVNYHPPMVSCTQVTEGCECVCVRGKLWSSPASRPICHMKVIPETRCNCGVCIRRRRAKRSCACVCTRLWSYFSACVCWRVTFLSWPQSFFSSSGVALVCL